MVWHIRGNRILSDREALDEDSASGLWLQDPLFVFASFFVMCWWLFGLEGWALAFLLAVAIAVLANFIQVVDDWSFYFCAGVLAWKALHWGPWGILTVVAVVAVLFWVWVRSLTVRLFGLVSLGGILFGLWHTGVLSVKF